jgi:hypothetical protein
MRKWFHNGKDGMPRLASPKLAKSQTPAAAVIGRNLPLELQFSLLFRRYGAPGARKIEIEAPAFRPDVCWAVLTA